MGKISPHSHLFHATNIKETNAIAAQILQKLGQRGVISLEGPLGAGKTHFVKGVAIAMGVTDEVTSPTFTLLQSYGSCEKRLHHGDFYRLQSEAEALELGLDDYFAEGLTIIEWGNKFPNILPQETIRIVITPLEHGERAIEFFLPKK
ncbi:MAG: tRNA (adenosine(37)-N6)-threonylcarbamoyltransferase complex ATPase subunit type 1 TsaE [Chthoniobacterales bacterium]|nr:tRNA (adenosine(37)-N6)-threonylcarbamoyltransferase complex ATPase subunit type 1 TsaE [Chthoniobacterales bacterium]